MSGQDKATRPKTMDERFDDVSVAIAEQRDYTTFCFEKLTREVQGVKVDVKATENRLTRRLDRHEGLLSEILKEVRANRPAR